MKRLLIAFAAAALAAAVSADTVEFTDAPYSVLESVDAEITVTRTGTGAGAVSVQYATIAGTAAMGDDFGHTSGTLTWGDGEQGPKTFTVSISHDGRDEPDEFFTVQLSGAVGATINPPESTTVTIIDDDPLQININEVSVSENDTGIVYMTFTVALTAPHTSDVLFDWTTVPGTATPGVDYYAASGTDVVIPAGSQFKELTINVIADEIDELDETLYVDLSNIRGGAVGYVVRGIGTIMDDDAPCIRIRDAEATEGDTGTTIMTFEVYLSDLSGAYAISAQPVSMNYTLIDGSATFGADYHAPGGVVTIPAGVTSAFVNVSIVGDLEVEGTENFFVRLDNAVNATFCDNRGEGTILDNDSAGQLQFSAGSYEVQEDVAGGLATITVTRTGGIAGTVSATYTVTAGSATAGDDFTAASGTVTFVSGQVSQTFTVAIIDDAIDELDETVLLSLSDPQNGATLGLDAATLTIRDDDPLPQVSIADASAPEGDSGSSSMTFTVSLSNPSHTSISFDYATSDGTALAGSDYTASSGSVTIPAGSTSGSIAVTILGDLVTEGNETFSVQLSNPSGAALGDGQAVGTIVDDDPVPQISIDDISLAEGSGGGMTTFAFTVSLSGQTQQTVLVNWTTTAGTASAGSDYAAASGQLSIPPMATSGTINVTVFADSVAEPNETFFVDLSTPVNATIERARGTATILDDETTPVLSISDAGVLEGNSGTVDAVFVVSLSGPSSQIVTVNYSTADGTAVSPGDYTARTGTLTFVPGDVSEEIRIPVIGDLLNESNESFVVTLAAPTNAQIGDGSAIGTITDDDSQPSVSVNSVTVTEGGTASFTVSLSAPSGQPVSVSWTTSDGTAVAGSDYNSGSGTLNFAPGSTSLNVAVSTLPDLLNEPAETFTVVLSSPVNAILGNASGTGTISDDDPLPALSIDDVSVIEGDSGTISATFTVTLSAASGRTVTVNWATANGSAAGGADFAAGSGALSFAPGELTKSIVIDVNGDLLHEIDETYFVNLSGQTNASISDGQGVGTIIDDDAMPELSIADLSVAEGTGGANNALLIVTLSAPSGRSVSVNYTTADGTATAPGDYTPASGTLTIPAGSTTATISVPLVTDSTDEPDESFSLNLSGAVNVTVTRATAVVTIQDDDDTPAASISDLTVPEGNAGTTNAVLTVLLNRASAQTITIDWATVDVTATAGADYNTASGTLTFAPGETSKTVTVQIIGDRVDESNEVVRVVLSSADIDVTIADAHGDITIVDDDTAGFIVFPVSGLVTSEAGGTATFTIALATVPTAAVSVSLSSSDTSEGTVAPVLVTFDPDATSLTGKIVTVTGVDDLLADGDIVFTVITDPATSADPAYSGLNAADVQVTNTDNDTPGITVSPTANLVTTEAGGTASFSVVLNTVPVANVTIGISSSDVSEGTVSVSSLLFTPADALNPQFVTVTGVDDLIIDGTIAFTVVTAAASSSDPNYNGRNASDVAVTNLDDESQPRLTINDISVAEGNSGTVSAAFTVTLAPASAQTVTVQFATADGTATAGSDYTAASGTLTFLPGETTKTVSVPVIGDRVDELNETFFVGLSTAANAVIDDSTGEATIVDDDVAGFVINPATPLTTTEAGGSASFTVALTSVPTASVTLTVSSSNTAEGTVSVASLTFTAADALTPKIVTVTGVDDSIIDGNVDYTIVLGAASSGDPNYSGLDPADVPATNHDNDVAGITVAPTSGLITTEAGGTATFTVVLNTTPSANVTIGISSSDTTEGSVSTSSLTFTPATWNVAQTVTITGLDDAEADGNVAYSVITAPAISSDTGYNGLNAADVSVTNSDDDTASILVEPTTGLITAEDGTQATFTVRLNSQPTANVTIALSSSDSGEGTVSPSSLTFVPSTWMLPQTVTVTGVDDDFIDGNQAYTIVTAAAVSADLSYHGRNAADVQVSNTDDDAASIIVSPASGLVTSESGITATFSIRLSSRPSANVTVSLSSSNTAEGTVSPASVSIAPANWNVPVVVTVTGVDDAVADGDVSYNIVTGTAVSGDSNYNGINPADVVVINTDNDTPGITVTPTAGLETNEAGGVATFRIVLNTQPTAAVRIDLSSSDDTEGTVSPTFVTFDQAAWDTPQTVTISGVDDSVADGDIAYSIITAAAISADSNYHGRDAADVAVINLDDDRPGITVLLSGDLVTTEAGGTATFRVVLNTTPTADVTIGLTTSAPGEASVSPDTLVFTPANALVPQTVTLTGIDDNVDDGDVTYFAITAPAISSDPNYANRNGADVAALNLDDDDAGIVVEPIAGLVTTESGGTATFTVRLVTVPTAAVSIAIASSDGTEGTASPSTLVFTPSNALDAQTVTVRGVDDLLNDGDVPYVVHTAPAVSADPVYNGMDAADVAVTNTDNDGPPAISVSDISVTEGNSGTRPAVFTVTLSVPSTLEVRVAWSTANGTASFGADYVPASSTLVIPPGASSGTISIDVIGDVLIEENETFLLNLANPVNATIARAQAVATILNDDGAPVIVSLNPASACHNGAGFTLAVSGSGFVEGAQVLWNGSPRPTTFVGPGELLASIGAADLATAGSIPLVVANPAGAGTSEPRNFTVAADDEAPVVTAPESISLVQTTCELGRGGSSGATSALVAAFLRAATASDGCSIVTPLAPQVDGRDVDDSTFFPGGPTEVTFRFADAAGNIGTATASVTVELYGDADQSYVVDAADLVIIANHLVGNVALGQPPFLAPPALVDLNEDRKIDAVDLTILAHYLVENIQCLPHLRP